MAALLSVADAQALVLKDAQPLAARKQFHFVARANASRNQRACHHRTESFHRKRTIDGQTEVAGWVFRAEACGRVA